MTELKTAQKQVSFVYYPTHVIALFMYNKYKVSFGDCLYVIEVADVLIYQPAFKYLVQLKNSILV